MVITFKVLTPSRQDPFSRPCLGAHFFMFVAAFSGKVTILSPNLDPKARVLHVTFRLFFRPGTKRGPRGDQEVPKATKKRPWGSPGVPKREPQRCPGYPKRVLGDLCRANFCTWKPQYTDKQKHHSRLKSKNMYGGCAQSGHLLRWRLAALGTTYPVRTLLPSDRYMYI